MAGHLVSVYVEQSSARRTRASFQKPTESTDYLSAYEELGSALPVWLLLVGSMLPRISSLLVTTPSTT